MAKKTKAADLSIEEKLEQALVVPGYEPYKIPDNWCWVSLTKGFAKCLDSFRKPVNAKSRETMIGSIPYYGATGQVGWINNYLTNEHLVLLGEDGAPFFDPKKNKAYIIKGKAWVNNHAHILQSFYGVEGNVYLMHYLNIFNYHGFVNGTTRLKLTQEQMNIIPIPLAPLSEQHRIVERIESLFSKLDEAKEKAQEVIDSFETRKAAILHKAFSGELTAKWREENGVGIESWESTKIGNMLTEIKYGTSEKSDYSFDGIPVFRIPNIGDMTLIFDDVKKIQRHECSENEYLSENDILIIRSNGSKELVGKCALVPKINFKCTYASFLIRLRMKDSISSLYTVWYLTSEQARKQLFNKAKSSAGIHNINSKEISDISIVVPSKPEQNIITATLERLITKEKETVIFAESVIDQIDAMKKAILARAFRGELGTNNPEEESAVEMLKEILSGNNNEEEAQKPKRTRIVIPKEIDSLLKTELERKIIKLFLKSETGEVTAEEIIAVSSKKFDILNTIRILQKQRLIKKSGNKNYTKYTLVR